MRKFHEYNAHSARIFSDYDACEAEFSAGLAQVANCKAWNPATGTFDMTRLNMSWAKPIHTRWTKREKMRQEKLKKIQGKLNEEVVPKNKKELFENYYWSTNANAWISKKTGKPVPELSGIANKIMRTEPPKMNNDLLEYYNKMATTGIDPLTGRKLTNSEIQQAKLLQIATALTPSYQAAILAKMAPKIEEYGERKPISIPEVVTKLDKLTPTEINQMSLEQLRSSIPEGWKFLENNGRVHIKGANGKMRIRIDPADKVTNYQHMHIFDEKGNPLDKLGNIVDRKSPNGHLPWSDK